MFNAAITKLATLACTAVLSATCVIGAIGPATASVQQPVASAPHSVA